MGALVRILLLTGAIAGACLPAAASPRFAPWESHRGFTALHWVGGRVMLPSSHLWLTVPAHAHGFVGADNDAYQTFTDGDQCTCEGRIRFPLHGTLIYTYVPSGHIYAGDFRTLNAAELLKSIWRDDRDTIRQYGTGYPFATRWIRRPAYDSRRHIVTWMVRKRFTTGQIADDARALVLTRFGAELVTADIRTQDARVTWGALRTGVAAFAIPAGLRYGDVRRGDPGAFDGLAFIVWENAGGQTLPPPIPVSYHDDGARILQAVLFGVLLLALGFAFAVAYAVRSGIRKRGRPAPRAEPREVPASAP